MTKATSRKKPEIAHWQMLNNISREVTFNIGIPGDMYHGLQISRFPSQIQLAEFRAAPYRDRTMPRGLIGVTNGLDSHLMIVEKNVVNADARLSLYYGDDCGPAYAIEGYFSNGGLVCVNGDRESTETYIATLREHMSEDNHLRLKEIFSGLLQNRLTDTDRAFRTIQGLVKNSDLPYHYIDAVKGIL